MKVYISGYDWLKTNDSMLKKSGYEVVNSLEECDVVYFTAEWQEIDKSIKEHARAGVLEKKMLFENGVD